MVVLYIGLAVNVAVLVLVALALDRYEKRCEATLGALMDERETLRGHIEAVDAYEQELSSLIETISGGKTHVTIDMGRATHDMFDGGDEDDNADESVVAWVDEELRKKDGE